MFNKGTMMQNNFQVEYEKTTLQERIVIEDIEGPVRIIAAPGTSITNILALRIGKILSVAATLPRNILCFTSSDTASAALKKRLESVIGPDAFNVSIFTLPAFCEMIVQDNMHQFGNDSLKPVSLFENTRLLIKLIDSFPKNHPLKRYRSDVYHEIKNLQTLFSCMIRECRTVEYLDQNIERLLAGIPATAEYMNDLQTGPAAEKKEMLEKLRAGITEFHHYRHLLQINNRYHSDDLEYLAKKALEENQRLLSVYRQKFKYIQVNNYDLVSRSGDKLLNLLAGDNENPNILLVENDDINKAGIAGTNGIHSPAFVKPGSGNHRLVKPVRNYRITAPEEIMSKPVMLSYNSVIEEMAGITSQVSVLLQQNIDPGKIAIIYPDEKYCTILEQYFKLNNIPFCSRRNINILAQPFIHKIIQLLRYICGAQETAYGGDDLLFEILHFDWYNIPPFEIAVLSVEVNSKKYSSTPTAIRKLLMETVNAPAKDLFDTGISQELKRIFTILEKLIRDASNTSLQQLFENMIRDALVLDYAGQSDDSTWLMQLLSAFSNFINKAITNNPMLQLNEFIEVVDIMEKEGVSLPLCRISGNAGDVHLVHAAEAEEKDFDYVFIAGENAPSCAKKTWLNSVCKHPGPGLFSIPGTSNKSLRRPLQHLFFAALSRPASQLVITFAKFNEKGEALAPGEFASEIISLFSLPVKNATLTDDELTKYAALHRPKLRPEIAQLEEAFITPILQKFVMNVSALNSYLNCPLGFYYQNIIRIPEGNNEAMQFGSAIHYTLENLFKKMSSGYTSPTDPSRPAAGMYRFPSPAEMLEDFSTYMHTHRINFSNEAFERRMQYGKEILKNYYDQYINSWNKVVSVERNIRGIMVNGVPLKGKPDKLEFNGKEVNIVDYKTGDIEKALPKLNPPNEVDPNGGDYWRQAVFYKILLDNYNKKDWRVVSAEFDFIEPDKKMKFRKEKIVIGMPDIETVKQQFTDVWAKIQARKFYTGCGGQDCHWCNFVKDNNMAVAWH